MWTRALLVGMVAVVGLARAAYPSADQYATPRNHHRAAADAPLDKQTPSDKWSGFDAAPDDQDASYELGFGIIDENDNLLEAKNSSARRKDDDLFFAYVVEPTLLAANSEGNSPKKRSSSSTSENDEPEAVMSLPELLRLWGLDTAKEVATKRVQRGDIEVTERPVARGDVPLAESQPAALSRRSKRDSGRKLLWASGKDKTRSFGEDDVLLKGGQPSGESIKDDADQQTKRPEHHENKDLPREDPEEEEKKRRQEEEERRLVELGHRQEEEERRLVELGHRQEEEERRLVELGLRKKEEESRLVELELRKKEEVRRKEEVVRTQEEEVRRKEEEVRRKEEEVLRQEEEVRRQAEEVLRQEEEVRRQEEEKRRQEQQRKGAEDELVKPDDTDNVKMHHKKADDDQRVQEREVATKRVKLGDIKVTERRVDRSDVPLAESQPAALSRRSKRDSGRKLLWASGKDKTRSFGEDDVLLKGGQPSGESIKDDADQQTKRPEHHENKDLPREDPEEEEKKRRQEEEERRLVELGHRQEEEERRLVELGHRQEEEERRLVELGLRKKEEESRLVELELRKKEEESRLVELELRKKEEVRRKEEVVRTQEEEVRRKEEEVRRKEEEVLRQEEEVRRQAEEVLRQEEEVRRQEEEKRRQEQQRKGAEDELVKPDDTDNVKMHHKKADDDQRVQEREVATKRVKLGDIKVTERRVDRSDVPLAKSQPAALSRRSKRNSGRKLLWANDKDRMWGFSEDDGLLQGDQPSGESSRDDVYQQTTRPEHHRKHHQNRYENEGRPREDEEEEEKRRRQMEAGRRQEEEGRRQEEERRRQEEERRRQEEDRRRQDQQRKGIGNELRKPDDEYDARMQEWYRKKAEHDRLVQEREEARKRPSQPHSSDELERERKLQDYIRRNTPIRPGQPASSLTDPRRLPYDRKREEECCRRLQEERDNRNNEQVRKAELERRRHEQERRREEQERRREEQRRRQDDELAQRPTSPQGDNRRRHEASKTRPPVDDTSTEQMRRHDSKRPRPDTKTDGKDGPRPGGSESRMNGNRWRDEENRRRYLEFKRKESSSSSARQPAQPTKADVDESRKLQGLPVDARIIIRRPDDEANATAAAPLISLRAGGPDEEIDFPGFSPGRRGPQAQHFPAPVTKRPLAKSPAPCVWALVVCCNQQHNDPRRQMRCFEGAACLSWDADRCRKDNVNAANDELLKFYVGQAARTRPKNTIILS